MEKILHKFKFMKSIKSLKLNPLNGGFFKVFLMFILLLTGLTSKAADTETVLSLVGENRVVSAALELHITSADAPFTNSTVSLNHEDAWLFFDNIKPSVVIANYLGNVLVNGNVFVDGTNGRVAIYAHGTVLMPHASSFSPLTVFKGDDFTGESAKYGIHTYYKNLGGFDNAIKSFKLKRGYMATLANNSDGSGYSRIFIADDEDKEFSLAPGELYGSVSFIRVFKHQWTTKKGKAGWDPNILNCTTYYDWNIGGNSSSDYEYVTIRQNAGWPSWEAINNKSNVSHLLGFNEPDRPDQSNMTFENALAMWPEYMQSGLRLGCPATSDPFNSWSLINFIDKCDELNYRVDFIAIHAYWAKSPTQWYNDLKYLHERTGRPIWITEWNNGANWTTETWPDADKSYTEANAQKQLNDIKGILQVLDTAHFVERYFIYDWVQDCRSMVLNNTLTKAGEYYAANKSQIAYKSINEVIPHWNFVAPSMSYRYLSLSNSIRISWEDGNGELNRGFRLEKKINNNAYQVIYESNDLQALSYVDPLDTNVSGIITYRVSSLMSNSEYLPSEEVSYYQTGGLGYVQLANMNVKKTDWATCLFSKKYANAPVVVLGMPTFSFIPPVSARVNSISTTSFTFILNTWSYLNKPAMTNSDVLSVMALPAGNYDLQGVKAEAATVSGVERDWVTVNFNQTFNSVPVVFCTQTSSITSFPTSVAIRNVTKTGFEMSLLSEQAITSNIFSERVSYLAIEEGQGIMEGKRFTVGKVIGLKSSSIIVDYDETYTNPVFFGGLQTSENAFASTVRYFESGAHSIKLLKQREMSGGLSAVLADEAGWLIMDISPDQVASSVGEKDQVDYQLYPNPTDGIIYFNTNTDVKIEVFDIAGQKQFETISSNKIDISLLPKGIYLLRIDDAKISKIVKK